MSEEIDCKKRFMVLSRKRDPGYYDRWQVLGHYQTFIEAEEREQEFAKRAKKSTTAIVATIGKPYSTVPGNGIWPDNDAREDV